MDNFDDRQLLNQFMKSNVALSSEIVDAVVAQSFWEEYPRGSRVISQGEVCDSYFLLLRGLYRIGARNDRGEEFTTALMEGPLVLTSPYSRLTGQNARSEVHVLEAGSGYRLPFHRLDHLIVRYPPLGQWLHRILLCHLANYERRRLDFSIANKQARYMRLLELRPTIVNRVPLKYIAQYLEMTPATLSRVRQRTT